MSINFSILIESDFLDKHIDVISAADSLDGNLVIPYSNIVIPNGMDDREKRGCPCACVRICSNQE